MPGKIDLRAKSLDGGCFPGFLDSDGSLAEELCLDGGGYASANLKCLAKGLAALSIVSKVTDRFGPNIRLRAEGQLELDAMAGLVGLVIFLATVSPQMESHG